MTARLRVCETHADEGTQEAEGPLALRVGGVDVEPVIAEANLDSGVIRTLVGGTDFHKLSFLWQRRHEWLDDAGLEVGRGDLDAVSENTQDLPGRARFYMNRRGGTADRLVQRQEDRGSVKLRLDADQFEEFAHAVAMRILVVMDVPEVVNLAPGPGSLDDVQHTGQSQSVV